MAKEKELPLLDPIRGHDGEVKLLRFREPKFPDLIELGEPITYARSDGGLVYSTERDDVVRSYCERLLIEPKDTALLTQLGLADSLRLKDLIHSFFGDARARTTSS